MMLLRLVLVVVLVVVACRRGEDSTPAGAAQSTSVTPAQDDAAKEELRQLVRDYKKAVYAKDGEASVAYVSERTVEYYDRMRDAALHAPAARVRSMRLLDRLMVLALRARMKPNELATMTGRDLLVHAVEQGWIGEDGRHLEPDNVEVHGDEGFIGLGGVDGQMLPAKVGFHAYRENGRFKLDLLSVTPVAEMSLSRALAEIDADEDAALVKMLEMMVGDRLPPTIWDPPSAGP